ncbi:lamin tail domain-containing protein [Thermococcus sp. EP1]|uniref:lamin tail domain-containing protein n=1 Tax=Thermococcus sp. EP1 TaxID=1591054 RepID=UPI0006DC6F10|nr:lamin tail domain-containing protein [Thermococcus sp. EP1]
MRGQGSIEYTFMLSGALLTIFLVLHTLAVINPGPQEIINQISVEINEELTAYPNQNCDGIPNIVIYYVNYDAGGRFISDMFVLNDEYVIIANIWCKGVNLKGWRLTDEKDHVFTFPEIVINPGDMITIHTGKGTNNETDLYWGNSLPVWNNEEDTAYLYSVDGTLIDKCSWSERGEGSIKCH